MAWNRHKGVQKLILAARKLIVTDVIRTDFICTDAIRTDFILADLILPDDE